MTESPVIVVGAGPAGLAVAACLKRAAIDYVLIEKEDQAGSSWRGHYDRLHLHTPASLSSLPYLPYPPGTPRFPSRKQFVDYLDAYCRAFGITPVFNTEMRSASRTGEGWGVETAAGWFQSRFLVMATGRNQRPRPFHTEGLDSFTGRILHSAAYRSACNFEGRKVLVVGFGNSGGEIALDLAEHNAQVVMSVRSPVNVIPRDLFGIPILYWSLILSRLPPALAARISRPLIRRAMGNLAELGLQQPAYGPAEQIKRFAKIPLLDIGTIDLIRQGKIRVMGGVKSVAGNQVFFSGDRSEAFDDIIAATGYEDAIPPLGVSPERVEDLKISAADQALFGRDGLYGCGYPVSGTGTIRAMAMDARQIAADIRRKIRN